MMNTGIRLRRALIILSQGSEVFRLILVTKAERNILPVGTQYRNGLFFSSVRKCENAKTSRREVENRKLRGARECSVWACARPWSVTPFTGGLPIERRIELYYTYYICIVHTKLSSKIPLKRLNAMNQGCQALPNSMPYYHKWWVVLSRL